MAVIQVEIYVRRTTLSGCFLWKELCMLPVFVKSLYLFKRVSKVFYSGKMTLNARAGTLFMLLFVKATKKNILATLAVW